MAKKVETRPEDVLAKGPYINDIYIRRIFTRIKTGSLRYHARKIIWNTLYRLACCNGGDNVIADMLFAAYRMGVDDGYEKGISED